MPGLTLTHGAPDDEDEPIGAALARLRRAKGFTGAQLAAAVEMSQPRISRIERGHSQPEPRDIGRIARALGADDEQTRALIERAERQQGGMTDWRPATPGPAGTQRAMTDWEAAAGVLRIFELAIIPGALQTSGYAKAVLREMWPFVQPATDPISEQAVLAAVSARIRRQEALANPDKSFRFLLGEATLRPRVYPPAEMLAQINHLRDVIARNDNVSIGIVRDGAATIPLLHSFTLLDDKLVIIDLFNTGLTSRGRQELDSYRRVFDLLEEHAVDIGPVLDEYQARYVDLLRGPASE